MSKATASIVSGAYCAEALTAPVSSMMVDSTDRRGAWSRAAICAVVIRVERWIVLASAMEGVSASVFKFCGAVMS